MLKIIKKIVPTTIKDFLRPGRDYLLQVFGLDTRKIPLNPPYPVFNLTADDYVLPSELDTDFKPGHDFMVIAHRGARLEAKENTLDAFNLAKNIGANVVEIDIRISADGHLVIHHDKNIDKKYGENILIEDKNVDELSEYGVTRLEEAFSELPDLGYILDFKVKGRLVIEKMIEMLNKFNMREKVLFEGHYTYLDNHKYWRMPRLELSELLKVGDKRSKKIIANAKADGKIVYASVMPGDLDRMKILIELGIDGIMTADIRSLCDIAKNAGVIRN